MNHKSWLFLPLTLVLFFFGELNQSDINLVLDHDIPITLLDSDTTDQSSDLDDDYDNISNHKTSFLELLPVSNLYNDVSSLFETKNFYSFFIRAPPVIT